MAPTPTAAFDAAYDAACLHGGPDPALPEVGEFCKAAASCAELCMEATREVFLTVRAGDDERDATALAAAELDALFGFWARPKEAGLIGASSAAICFACAVDALAQDEAHNARFFVRLGAFVRLVHARGLAGAKADVASDAGAARERVAPLVAALAATTNARGVARFLRTEIPCACVAALAGDAACVACCKPLPEKAMRCARCRSVVYCDRTCQMHDWKRHRTECKAPPA